MNYEAYKLFYEQDEEQQELSYEDEVAALPKRLSSQMVKNSQAGSVTHLALNLYRSIHPFGFDNLFTALQKFKSLREKIWRVIKSHERAQGIDGKQLAMMMLDPSSEDGQKMLKEVSYMAKPVGLDGKEVTAWSQELYKTPLQDGEEAIDTGQSISSGPEGEEIQSRGQLSRESIALMTKFLKDTLTKAKESGVLDDLDRVLASSRSNVSGPEALTAYGAEMVLKGIAYKAAVTAVKGILEYELLSAGQNESALNEEEEEPGKQYMKKDDEFGLEPTKDFEQKVGPYTSDFKDKSKQIFKALENQLALSGLNLLPATVKSLSKQWLDLADEALRRAGFDEEIGKELTFFARRIDNPDFPVSPIIKKAINDTAVGIARTLNTGRILKELVNQLINHSELDDVFASIDKRFKGKITKRFQQKDDQPFVSKKVGKLKFPSHVQSQRVRRPERGRRTIEFLGEEGFSFRNFVKDK